MNQSSMYWTSLPRPCVATLTRVQVNDQSLWDLLAHILPGESLHPCICHPHEQLLLIWRIQRSQSGFPTSDQPVDVVSEFDHLCYLTALMVVLVTLKSGALIYLSSKYFHPSNKLFKGQSCNHADNKGFESGKNSSEVGNIGLVKIASQPGLPDC